MPSDDDDDLDSYWEAIERPEWDPDKFIKGLAVEYINNNPFYLGLFADRMELDCPRKHLVMGSDGTNTERIDFEVNLSEFKTVSQIGLFTTMERYADPLILGDLALPITIGPGCTACFLPGSIVFQGLPAHFETLPYAVC